MMALEGRAGEMARSLVAAMRSHGYADDEISIGDYVLSGGELPALVIIDSVMRLLPGVLGDFASAEEDSFQSGLLDVPLYTRPREFRGMEVPEVLISGDHGAVDQWRREQAERITRDSMTRDSHCEQRET